MAFLYVLLAALGGGGQPVQTAMNARMRVEWGSPVLPALASLIIGVAALGVVLATGVLGRGDLSRTGTIPWWAWAGGLIGAASVTINLVVLPKVGVAVTIGAAVSGQLLVALLLDHFGWFGVERVPFNVWRLVGAAFLIAGTWLLQKR
jgi:transporter family-2 protein